MTADPYQDIYPPEEAVDAYGAPPPPAAPDNPYGYPHVEPVQGYGDRLALALRDVQMPQFPTTRYQGQPSGAGAAFLTGLLTGGAQGYSGNRVRKINEREKLNAALAQKAHDENVRALAATTAATTESRKARIVTPELASANNWPVRYIGKSLDELPTALTEATAEKKKGVGNTISLSDVQNSGGALNMGDVGTDWSDAGIKKRVAGKAPVRPPTGALATLESGDKENIAGMFRRGELNPDMLNLAGRGVATPILAILAKPGPNGEPPWDQAKASLQWRAMRALTQNANGPQILSLQRAASSVQAATGLMEDLNKQLTEAVRGAPLPRSEVPESNKISLAAALRGAYGQKALDVARKFDTQIRVIRNEYPVVLSGGYAPQQAQIADAEAMMSPWYGEGGTQAALDILKKDAAYKIAAINGIGANTPGIFGENPYAGPTQLPFLNAGAPPQAPGAPPAAAPPTGPRTFDVYVPDKKKVYHFQSQQAADSFRRDAGLR